MATCTKKETDERQKQKLDGKEMPITGGVTSQLESSPEPESDYESLLQAASYPLCTYVSTSRPKQRVIVENASTDYGTDSVQTVQSYPVTVVPVSSTSTTNLTGLSSRTRRLRLDTRKSVSGSAATGGVGGDEGHSDDGNSNLNKVAATDKVQPSSSGVFKTAAGRHKPCRPPRGDGGGGALGVTIRGATFTDSRENNSVSAKNVQPVHIKQQGSSHHQQQQKSHIIKIKHIAQPLDAPKQEEIASSLQRHLKKNKLGNRQDQLIAEQIDGHFAKLEINELVNRIDATDDDATAADTTRQHESTKEDVSAKKSASTRKPRGGARAPRK